MKHNQVHAQYSTGLSRHNIEQALIAAGKNLDRLQPADLGLLEDFHTMGRIATSQLVDLIEIATEDEVLDAGSGIGGTARFVADQCRCRVTAVDLTEEYCETARWLNRLVGLDDLISVRQADVTELPFADATFQVAFSQHVQMNVADKARLYQEARRVLVDGGRLAMWDITSGGRGDPDYALQVARQCLCRQAGRPRPIHQCGAADRRVLPSGRAPSWCLKSHAEIFVAVGHDSPATACRQAQQDAQCRSDLPRTHGPSRCRRTYQRPLKHQRPLRRPRSDCGSAFPSG